MAENKRLRLGALAAALAAAIAGPASATTLIRLSLDDLVGAHSKIVLGEVLDAHSYWNHDGNFILTDVRFSTIEVVKGSLEDTEITITILGGEVGDLATVIIGGAELIPGKSYLLFLNEQELPGAKGALTVREHVQGAFDLERGRDGLRAVSQASRHPLMPDKGNQMEPPGGRDGLLLDTMVRSVRTIAARQGGRPEVK